MLHFFDELRKRYESYLKKICKEGNRQFFFLYKKCMRGVMWKPIEWWTLYCQKNNPTLTPSKNPLKSTASRNPQQSPCLLFSFFILKQYTRQKRSGKGFNKNRSKARKINASTHFETWTEQLSPFGGLLALIKFLDLPENRPPTLSTKYRTNCLVASTPGIAARRWWIYKQPQRTGSNWLRLWLYHR
jgi:hypothetical protein